MIKALIFDFDGVVLESANIKTEAFGKLFERDYPQHVKEIVAHHLKNMGISRFVKFRHAFDNIIKLPLTKELERELGERFSKIVLEEILVAPFVPGTEEFLKEYHQKIPIYVATGTPEEEMLYVAEQRGLTKYFKEIAGSPAKKTEIVIDILTRYGYSPTEVLFVGDATTDMKAASATGLHFVARITPDSEPELLKCQHKMKDLTAFAEFLGAGL
jgi:HAD superfamily hydrolase (TIGR01549 family)